MRHVQAGSGKHYRLSAAHGPKKKTVQWRQQSHKRYLKWLNEAPAEKIVLPPITSANTSKESGSRISEKDATTTAAQLMILNMKYNVLVALLYGANAVHMERNNLDPESFAEASVRARLDADKIIDTQKNGVSMA